MTRGPEERPLPGHAPVDDVLRTLGDKVRARRGDDPNQSYTAKLIAGGPSRCARKLGEEAIELVLAAVAEDDKHVTAEAADLLYHLLVLLEVRKVSLDDVLHVLKGRMAQSGHAEKASRKPTG